jgi:hypothetical protein
VIRAAALGRFDHLRRELQVLVASGGVEIVMLQEHGRGQDDIGIARRLSHELLVNARENVVARKSAANLRLMRIDRERIGVLDQHGPHGRASSQGLRVAREH